MGDFIKIVIVLGALLIALFFAYNYLDENFGFDMPSPYAQQIEIDDAEAWANTSPLVGRVMFATTQDATTSDPANEYLRITASSLNEAAVDMTGWSIESLVSETRVYLPPAVLLVTMGTAATAQNSPSPVHLAPGEWAVLHTGASPLANAPSFHSNSCMGYLAQFTDFTPRMSRSTCKAPSDLLPPTVENIKAYGAECIEFLAQAQSCTTYTTQMPAHLLPACRELVASKLTYHSCLSESYGESGYDIFNNGGWYLYLHHTAELWRDNYEVLRLLDQNGQVVDVFRY